MDPLFHEWVLVECPHLLGKKIVFKYAVFKLCFVAEKKGRLRLLSSLIKAPIYNNITMGDLADWGYWWIFYAKWAPPSCLSATWNKSRNYILWSSRAGPAGAVAGDCLVDPQFRGGLKYCLFDNDLGQSLRRLSPLFQIQYAI